MPAFRQGIAAYLKVCPFPKYILELGEDGVTDDIKGAVKKTVGRKKSLQPVETAKESVGVDYGEEAARLKLQKMQALIGVSKKILTLIHTLAKKKESYDPERLFGYVRREQLKGASRK